MVEVMETSDFRAANTHPIQGRLAPSPTRFLEAQKVQPWSDMPVWVPPVGEYAGWSLVSNARAVAAGLTFRSLADTTRTTLEFVASRSAERNGALRAGLPPQREKEILAAFAARARA